jgi:hypothetical protein
MPIGPQVGLATNHSDLANTFVRHLLAKSQTLLEAEFILTRNAGSGTAVLASQITFQGEFPHHVERVWVFQVLFCRRANQAFVFR